MRDDLTQTLYTTYADLYADHVLDDSESLMGFGFLCDDGWYDIIFRLSATLTTLIAANPDLDPATARAFQVKEKFGTLRFYMRCTNAEMQQAIRQAEEESGSTCEMCGGKGEMKNDEGWLVTLCEGCLQERQRRKLARHRRDSGVAGI
jgi:hypothetical protein